MSNHCVGDALLVEIAAESLVVLLRHLYHDAWVFGKECLYDVAVVAQLAEVDMHTALDVCECHLKQCGYDAAGTDVMSAVDESAVDKRLYGVEGIGEILRILHRRHVVAHLAEALCKGAAAQALLVEREVYMVERGGAVVDHHWAYHLAHVRNLTAAGYDDRTRSYHLLSVGILLRHGKRVLSCRHVDVESTAEVAQCLHGTVEACVLAFL